MDRGAWWTTVHGIAKESDTTEVTEHLGPEVRQCFTRAPLFPSFKLHMNPGTGPAEDI